MMKLILIVKFVGSKNAVNPKFKFQVEYICYQDSCRQMMNRQNFTTFLA